MKVLVVGGGGREHAIVWKLKQDDPELDVIAAPGNPGIASLARCVPVATSDTRGLVALAEAERTELVVVGPEAPLAAGLVDALRSVGRPTFGPTLAAAQLEASKRFAKEVMLEAGVPTAGASWHASVASAKRAARILGAPLVVKASGLASGKGVIVCGSIEEADIAIDGMLLEGLFGAAGSEVLVEEFMEGEELSIFAVTDGNSFLTMLPAQDHKRLLDGDEGPNTGGMGAYAPVSVASPTLVSDVETRIIAPTLGAMRDRGTRFSGVLYVGIMVTNSGPRVVEFNCRFGDPETQVVLPMLRHGLLDLLIRSSESEGLSGHAPLQWNAGAAVTTVVASAGYPGAPLTGKPIALGELTAGSMLFHSGTRTGANGGLVTSGGRVFSATGVGESFEEAIAKSTRAAESASFDGAFFRRDIGWRELGRRARAS